MLHALDGRVDCVVFAGMHNILVGAVDAKVGKEMVAAHINSFAMYNQAAVRNHSGTGTVDDIPWGGDLFFKLNLQKIAAVQLLLGFELSVVLLDADVVILRNVLPYFAK